MFRLGVVVGAGLGVLSAAQKGENIWRGVLTGALLGGIIGAAAGLALAGAATVIVAGIGKTFLKEGTKSFFRKFSADLTAYITFSKEIESIESYMSSFVFGGALGASGLTGKWKAAVDI